MADIGSKTEPIVYDYTLDVHFGDLDQFGHVNVKHYLDMVNTSRLIYFERVMGVNVTDLIKKGVGFYVSKITQEFLKPIIGLAKVRVQSHVGVVEGGKLSIPFEMSNPENGKLYSKGELVFYVIDLSTQKPMNLPDWMRELFFKKKAIE